MQSLFPATRAAALSRFADFVEQIPAYSSTRSFVAFDRGGVSCLSPYIRRRLISEEEIVCSVLGRYPFHVAEKFIQEVVWRTYWKGWLERNPWAWSTCVEEGRCYDRVHDNQSWRELYEQAQQGETHLSFFNEWIRELRAEGYLHNHVRMWFASVWIFTFKIPWQLGAMFMYRHLLDGDPASNTLSWRWVAGLQTKGKYYLAKADNIAKFSHGRWNPAPGELAEQGFAVDDSPASSVPQDVAGRSSALPDGTCGVLTTSDDLSVDLILELGNRISSIALLRTPALHGESELVRTFVRTAEDDTLQRLAGHAVAVDGVEDALDWAESGRLSSVLFVVPPVGPNNLGVAHVAERCAAAGIACSWYRRNWDEKLYQLADKGFFPFWERVTKRILAGDPLFYGKSLVR